METMRSSSISIVVYGLTETTIKKAIVQYVREDNDLMFGTIIETTDKEWSEKNYRQIVEFADKELRSLGVFVR